MSVDLCHSICLCMCGGRGDGLETVEMYARARHSSEEAVENNNLI